MRRNDSEKITVYVTPKLKHALQALAEQRQSNVSREAAIALTAYVLHKRWADQSGS